MDFGDLMDTNHHVSITLVEHLGDENNGSQTPEHDDLITCFLCRFRGGPVF